MNDKYDEYAKDNENDEDNDDVKDIASPDLSLCIARHFLLPSPTVRQSRAQPGTFSPTCTSLEGAVQHWAGSVGTMYTQRYF